MADFGEALRLDPKSAMAYYNRGLTHIELDRYEEAIADLTQALLFDPDDVDARYNRGLAHYYLDECEEALADFQSYLRLAPPGNPWGTEAQQLIDEIRKL